MRGDKSDRANIGWWGASQGFLKCRTLNGPMQFLLILILAVVYPRCSGWCLGIS